MKMKKMYTPPVPDNPPLPAIKTTSKTAKMNKVPTKQEKQVFESAKSNLVEYDDEKATKQQEKNDFAPLPGM